LVYGNSTNVFQDPNRTVTENQINYPKSFGFAVFRAFEPIDVFGSFEVLENLAGAYHINVAVIAETLAPVTNQPEDATLNKYNSSVWQSLMPTHTFKHPPEDLEVLIVPGGIGTFYPRNATVDFIRKAYPKLKYLLSVCTGAMLLAEAGVLDGKSATTNKATWPVATLSGPKVKWVPKARWVVDGNIWTSSGGPFFQFGVDHANSHGVGESAGIDSILGWVECLFGTEAATLIANNMEYERHTDPSWDPFSAVWNVTQS
jgi:transcriptional regulator GlxA family with amidase domain